MWFYLVEAVVNVVAWSLATVLYGATCEVSLPVRAIPPQDARAGPFSEGPWYINADRTIWAGWRTTQSTVGRNMIVWIRPAGTKLLVEGERLDGEAPPLTAQIPCCYTSGFQMSVIVFPTAGCWRVRASAGDYRLTFVVAIGERPLS
jgi:hypothetical protein